MQKKLKRWLSCGIVIVLILTLFIPARSVQAAGNPKFNVTKKTMVVGKSTTLKISNKVKNAKYVWKTSKKSVATVSNKGSVQAVGKGSAVISCSIKVNNKTKYTLKCKITVTEPVRKTFFERHNIEYHNGLREMEYMLCQSGSDVYEPMWLETSLPIMDYGVKEGYTSTAFLVYNTGGFTDKSVDYNITVFDRFTGKCLRSVQATYETNKDIEETTEDVSVIGVDGKKYDCSIEFSQGIYGGSIFINVIHPVEYDGIAFKFGSFSDEQKAIYDTIDFEKGYVLDDVPELWKNQYFFVSGITEGYIAAPWAWE